MSLVLDGATLALREGQLPAAHRRPALMLLWLLACVQVLKWCPAAAVPGTCLLIRLGLKLYIMLCRLQPRLLQVSEG